MRTHSNYGAFAHAWHLRRWVFNYGGGYPHFSIIPGYALRYSGNGHAARQL